MGIRDDIRAGFKIIREEGLEPWPLGEPWIFPPLVSEPMPESQKESDPVWQAWLAAIEKQEAERAVKGGG